MKPSFRCDSPGLVVVWSTLGTLGVGQLAQSSLEERPMLGREQLFMTHF